MSSFRNPSTLQDKNVITCHLIMDGVVDIQRAYYNTKVNTFEKITCPSHADSS